MKKIAAFFFVCILSLCIIPVLYSTVYEIQTKKIGTIENLHLKNMVNLTKSKCEEATASGKSLIPLLNKNSQSLENVSSQTDYVIDYSIILYDFLEIPSFIYVQFQKGGYAISNIETGNIYERAEMGSGPYEKFKSKKCYYGGVQNYFYRKNNDVITINGNVSVSNIVVKLQKDLNELKMREKEFMKGVDENESSKNSLENTAYRNHIVTIGNYNGGDFGIKKSLYFPMLSEEISGTHIYEDFNGFTDFYFPINDRNSCAFVALTMFLQFYERLDNGNTLPSIFDTDFYDYMYAREFGDIPNNNSFIYQLWKNNIKKLTYNEIFHIISNDNEVIFKSGKPNLDTLLKSNMVKTQKIHDFLYCIGDQGVAGETYNTGIVTCMERFCEIYPNHRKFTFTANSFWSNMKECIDRGMPSIGMTGLTATGYIPNNNDTSYESKSVARHQMVVYGYTVNSIGGPDEFICHSGWHGTDSDNVYSMIFTSGWSFAGNVTITENY